MRTRTARSLATLLAAASITPAVLASSTLGILATSSENQPPAKQPHVSVPWWMRPAATQVAPLDGAPAGAPVAAKPIRHGIMLDAQTTISMPDGYAAVRHESVAKSDGVVTREGTVRLADGRVVEADGSITKDGEVVSRDAKIVLPDGRVVRFADLVTKEGATLNRDGTITLPSGQVMKVDCTIARDGDSVNRDSTVTLPDGRVVQRDATITRDGNTTTRNVQMTNPAGTTTRTTTVTRQKAGLQKAGAGASVQASPQTAPPRN